MKKDNIMSAVLGLVVGLVIGFVFANNVNKSSFEKAGQPSAPQAVTTGPGTTGDNPALPPNHPPLGTSSGEESPTGPQPEVMAAIEKAKKQPQDFESQMTAADLYYQISRFDEAAKFYEIAAKLKPSFAEPLIKAGDANFDGEKYEQAEKWYLLALEKEPKNVSVRNDLGLTFLKRSPRDLDRAIKELKASLLIDPNHEMSLQNLMVVYTENGDKAGLASTLDKFKKVNPNNPEVKKIDGNL